MCKQIGKTIYYKTDQTVNKLTGNMFHLLKTSKNTLYNISSLPNFFRFEAEYSSTFILKLHSYAKCTTYDAFIENNNAKIMMVKLNCKD